MEALTKFLEYPGVQTILDLGSGEGTEAKVMRDRGRTVTTISLVPPADVIGDYAFWDAPSLFDGIWCSHCLEHQPNVHQFLRKMGRDLREGGILAVIVPPLKHEVVGGHLNLFNAGTLLYNLIVAGFDCSKARVGCYGYNIAVLMQKNLIKSMPDLVWDSGDIERLAPFFPMPVREGFGGKTLNIRW